MFPSPDPPTAERSPARFLRNNHVFLGGTLLLVAYQAWVLWHSLQGDTLLAINKLRTPFLDVFFKIGTHFAEPVAYVAVVLIVAAFSYRRAIFCAVAGAVAGISAGLLKAYFSEARPMRWFFDNFPEMWNTLVRFETEWTSWAETSSFPSGHTASAFALYGFLSFNARTRRHWVALGCFLIAAMVGYSRIYLLYHFLRDVTAGALLGLLCGVVTYYLQHASRLHYPTLDRGWWADHQRWRSGSWS